MKRIHDVIIAGCGIAGLSAAIFLKEAGLDVVVITKEDDVFNTSTNLAQGGIVAWKQGDTPEQITEDILHAGCNYNNELAVKQFSEEGPDMVFDFLINKIGIEFTKTSQGNLDYTEEAAHSQRRILHFKDQTGYIIQNGLIEYARKINIPILTSHTAIDLITNNHHSRDCQEFYKPREVMGIYALNNQDQIIKTFFSHKVILATGGIGNLYQLTTNPSSSTGDGMSMAYRAGAEIINTEFIQFHPTALYHKDIRRFLISESLRGEGARLLDHDHKLFMERYSHLCDLAPRDVVSRAIYREMERSGTEYMLLDIASYYKGKVPLKERFSKVYSTCLEGGIDITKEPIPIVPAAHYFCGGIKVDLVGKSSIKNLFAVGEVSCTGLHGANRLASTSLLEGLLWAKKASQNIITNFSRIGSYRFDTIPDWAEPKYNEEFDPLLLRQDWKSIQMTMWNYAGIVKTGKGLERAKADLNYYSHRILKFYKESKLNKDIIELRNAIVNASIIVNAAYHNTKSIGCHYIV